MSRINGFSAKYISNVITLDWRNLIVDFLHFLRNYIYCLHDGAEFSNINPSFLTIKEGVFSTSPSLLQGELHFLPKPLFLRKRGCSWLCYSAARVLVSSAEPGPQGAADAYLRNIVAIVCRLAHH